MITTVKKSKLPLKLALHAEPLPPLRITDLRRGPSGQEVFVSLRADDGRTGVFVDQKAAAVAIFVDGYGTAVLPVLDRAWMLLQSSILDATRFEMPASPKDLLRSSEGK
ncbi:hypothetical protein FHS85_004923 [Rhodoligotrophos appendicifer]|uniref:hypothetical protein n=1 Tax=Rhodoligotrophos appendicifer TaxID=987056 RepID=UPI001184AD9D